MSSTTTYDAMVIEDDSHLGEICAEALRSAGYQPDIIKDGAIASSRLEDQTAPLLIVLDLHLPHVDGTQLLAQIRKQEHTAKTPVIITSADDRLLTQIQGEANFTLTKPIGFDQLSHLAKRIRTR